MHAAPVDSVEMQKHTWWQNLACSCVSRCRWHHMQWVSSHLADVHSCPRAEKNSRSEFTFGQQFETKLHLFWVWFFVCFFFSVCWCCLSLWSLPLFLERKKGEAPPKIQTCMMHVAIEFQEKNEGTDTQILYSACKHLQLAGWPNVTYGLFFHSTPLFLFFNLIYLSVKAWKFVLSMCFGTSEIYTVVSWGT